MKIASFVFTLTIMFSAVNVQAFTEKESTSILIDLNDDLIGYWDYHVPGVDPMYQNGILQVAKEGADYTVNIELPNGSIPTEDVVVNGNEVKFALYVEGGRVEVTVIFDGDTLTGSGTSDGGPFTLTGNRKPKPE